jgi:two-component system LytT family response regulator
MKPVRAFIAEDEPLAREALRQLVEQTGWLQLVGEAADGRSAVAAVERLRPDLLFLDVVMPELSGLEVLERLDSLPLVVFTTAHDRYAVSAFELGALDYLVKPFGPQRFRTTLERIRRTLDRSPDPFLRERIRLALAPRAPRRLFARLGRQIVPVEVAAVLRFTAEGDHVRAHTRERSFLLRVTLVALEERLGPERFLRIHRSHLVNLERIVRMQDHDDRRLEVVLEDGSRVVASRSGSRRLRELVG